ncbi:DUF4883 family protein [Clostridium sp. MB40-C1]|uniref:DUF4883 family protein n=1 Tax=Clostridium sp. MB40-C1 TaxID=3070996 RepID=UPI0027DFE287|nr:DUF4883 family protein [Clostridium sp. MB40-C1]WMJ80915.1 DUF4883 family protein [Clostridium sp. MB40-C1]
MKKGSLIVLILTLLLSIFISFKMYLGREKPSNYFYTNLLAKNITLCDKYEIKVLDTNFYKTETLSGEDIQIIRYFLKQLRKPNFIQKPASLNKKPEYKIFFTFKDTNEKYIINVYDNEFISVYPWDGDFYMDYINMKDIPIRYNIYSLCKDSFVKQPSL